MSEGAEVVVEFYGVPRLRAGRDEMTVFGRTVGEVINAVRKACPQLTDLLRPDGRLSRHYLLSLDGQVFFTDLTEGVTAKSRLLLLSADAGG